MKVFLTRSHPLLWSIAFCLFLSGCTSMRDLSVTEFRSQEFYIKTVQINMSVKDIEQVMQQEMQNLHWRSHYHKMHFRITQDRKKASIRWTTGGFAKPGTMALMDFQENLDEKSTSVKIYAANVFWEKKPEEMLEFFKYE